jgi:hypothetical protein
LPIHARDLLFSHRIQVDHGVPLWKLEAVKEMESADVFRTGCLE